MTSNTTNHTPWILVTNDDGPDSPTLVPLIRALTAVAPVRAVVPSEERSWTSKMLSRAGTLEAREAELDGLQVWTVNGGYPADCANIAVHNLFDEGPSLAVSGINMGTNAGLAYYLSSGTVGAAAECALSGILASAFSLCLDPDDYARWRRRETLSSVFADRVACAVEVTVEIVQELLRSGLPPEVSFLSVNMPATIASGSKRRITTLDSCSYGAFFEVADAARHFRHGPVRLSNSARTPNGDVAALDRGEVSITPIRLNQAMALEQSEMSRFER